MSYKSEKNKLSKVNDELIANRLKIESLSRDNEATNSKLSAIKDYEHLKTPTILYDSGEVVAKWSDGTIVTPPAWVTGGGVSAKRGMVVPLSLHYEFEQELNIPESLQPFVKSLITVRAINPDITILGSSPKLKYLRWNTAYKVIKGDTTLLYQGYDTKTLGGLYTQAEKDNGDFLANHTSKWYNGLLKYKIGSDDFEVRDGYMVGVKSYYNKTLSADGSSYDWDRMDVYAIDAISSSSCTGTGTKTISRMTNPSGDGVTWVQDITTTLNVTATFAIFEDITHLRVSGDVYKNDADWDWGNRDDPYIIKFEGSLNGESTVASEDYGDATLSSFSYSFDNEYKLWYSTVRAREFSARGDTVWQLYNTPYTTFYQTGTLPYTHMTYVVNPDPHPQEVWPAWSYRAIDADASYEYPISFLKSSNGETDTSYITKVKGEITMTAPADNYTGSTVWQVDEQYSHYGIGYSRDSEDRAKDKVVNMYDVSPQEVYVQMKLVCTNPIYYNKIKQYVQRAE